MGYAFGTLELILIGINILVSLRAFNNRAFFNKLSLHVAPILENREWSRLLTSGFVHVNGRHLFFNMLSLVFFAGAVEQAIGSWYFGLLYFVSLLGGNILSLFIHRRNGAYRAVGASGAVSGIVFAAIAVFPGMDLFFIFVPIPIPAWLFGVAFILYSIYGIRKQNDGIGHEAHMGGAVCGVLGAVLLMPQVLQLNGLTILLISIPCVLFILALLFWPHRIMPLSAHTDGPVYQNIEDKYHEQKIEQEEELNRILDKLKRHGPESLTREEEQFLKHFG